MASLHESAHMRLESLLCYTAVVLRRLSSKKFSLRFFGIGDDAGTFGKLVVERSTAITKQSGRQMAEISLHDRRNPANEAPKQNVDDRSRALGKVSLTASH